MRIANLFFRARDFRRVPDLSDRAVHEVQLAQRFFAPLIKAFSLGPLKHALHCNRGTALVGLLQRVLLDGQYPAYTVQGFGIGTAAFRKSAIFRAPSTE